jgi:predicted dehydrogenase
MNHPLQLGILGCGNFATRRILPALEKTGVISIIALQKRNLQEAVRRKCKVVHLRNEK